MWVLPGLKIMAWCMYNTHTHTSLADYFCFVWMAQLQRFNEQSMQSTYLSYVSHRWIIRFEWSETVFVFSSQCICVLDILFFPFSLCFQTFTLESESTLAILALRYTTNAFAVYDLQIMCRIHCSTALKLWYNLRLVLQHFVIFTVVNQPRIEAIVRAICWLWGIRVVIQTHNSHMISVVNVSRNSPME